MSECTLVGPASSVDYRLTPAGALDVAGELRMVCELAGHRYVVAAAAILARDVVRTCLWVDCATVVPCPAEADDVVCTACRLRQPGPFVGLDEERVAHLRRVHNEYLARVRRRAGGPGEHR